MKSKCIQNYYCILYHFLTNTLLVLLQHYCDSYMLLFLQLTNGPQILHSFKACFHYKCRMEYSSFLLLIFLLHFVLKQEQNNYN